MNKSEKINFKASVNAPNPLEVSYWIDLSMDRDGNVIKSYRPDVKKWIPLNRDANVDQWDHIQEIVNATGLEFDRETDIIELPDISSNNYFKGTSVVDAINNGDTAVKSQVTRLDSRIDTTNTNLSNTNRTLNNFISSITDENGDIKVDVLPDDIGVDLSNYYTKSEVNTAVETEKNARIAKDAQLEAALSTKASLSEDGKIPESQLPSYVDDVLEFASTSAFPITGESGKIYVSTSTNLTYRWSGSTYVEISPSIALGETSSTAYPGNQGKATTDNLTTHLADTTNPHSVTKTQVGLGNVDNTSDLNKPISTATQTALNTLTSSINTKISGTGVTDIQVVSALPESPNPTTLYIVITE